MTNPAVAGGEEGCRAHTPEYRVVAFDRLDSTNAEARRQAQAGAASGTVIWARCQEAGRGRRGRQWQSPAGNLYCSILLRPECSALLAAQVSLVAAVAVGQTIQTCLASTRPQLKWPNDVLVSGRKIAGILLECDQGNADQIAWLVVGIGVNVRHYPEETEYPATSLVREGAAVIDPVRVMDILLARFGEWFMRWSEAGLAPIRQAWLERAIGLGLPITIRLHNETLMGNFNGLDDNGALLLDSMAGSDGRRITAGDVFFPWLDGGVGHAIDH